MNPTPETLVEWKRVCSGMRLLSGFIFCVIVGLSMTLGYVYGRLWGNRDVYFIGLEHGYYNGVSDAYVAYKTSGPNGVVKMLSEQQSKILEAGE